MPSTHLSLHYHVVFGTKDHKPVMNATWRPRLHAYLGGLVKTLGGMLEAIGGAEDHHRTRTFRAEYLALLQRSGIEFDERYVF